MLFGFNKNTNKTVKSYMGFLNSVIKNWGLCIESKQKSLKKTEKNNKENFYYLSYNDLYNNFI